MSRFRARLLLPVAPLGALLAAAPTSSEALTVGRCGILKDGIYVPALVVKDGDNRSVHHIGDEGITRNMVFDEEATLDWAARTYGLDPASVTYSDTCIGRSGGDAAVVLVRDDDEGEGDGEGDGEGSGNDSPRGGGEEEPVDPDDTLK